MSHAVGAGCEACWVAEQILTTRGADGFAEMRKVRTDGDGIALELVNSHVESVLALGRFVELLA